MKYRHSTEQASEILRRTLVELSNYKLSFTPVNYSIWYEFLSEENPPLSTALADHLGKTKEISEETSYQIYQDYLMNRQEDLVDTIKVEFHKTIKEILNDLSAAGGDVSDFGNYLSEFSSRLETPMKEEDIISHFKALLQEVKKVNTSRTLLGRRLILAEEEVKKLQQRLEESKRHATTDALTGIWNRRSFEEKLLQQIKNCEQTKENLSLIMIDIDHFKRINDTYGHLTGDDLLRVIAKTLKDFVRGNDTVCRYGGEEFVVLLSGTALSGAISVAEKIRAHFTKMAWKQKSTGTSMGNITLSSGISQYRPGESSAAFVHRADIALYQSKKNGRNRVTTE